MPENATAFLLEYTLKGGVRRFTWCDLSEGLKPCYEPNPAISKMRSAHTAIRSWATGDWNQQWPEHWNCTEPMQIQMQHITYKYWWGAETNQYSYFVKQINTRTKYENTSRFVYQVLVSTVGGMMLLVARKSVSWSDQDACCRSTTICCAFPLPVPGNRRYPSA